MNKSSLDSWKEQMDEDTTPVLAMIDKWTGRLYISIGVINSVVSTTMASYI